MLVTAHASPPCSLRAWPAIANYPTPGFCSQRVHWDVVPALLLKHHSRISHRCNTSTHRPAPALLAERITTVSPTALKLFSISSLIKKQEAHVSAKSNVKTKRLLNKALRCTFSWGRRGSSLDVVTYRMVHKGLQEGQRTAEALNEHSQLVSRTSSGRSLRLHDELDKAKLLVRAVSLAPVYAVNKLYPNCFFAVRWSFNSGGGIVHIPFHWSPLPPLIPSLQNESVFQKLQALSGFFPTSCNYDATKKYSQIRDQ